ncbi:alpha/beta fold hydrolase [Nitrospira moscoviensis]|uniref:alpha/beta fold hydrolase n=1 Tax=Nitrospira moscoviensis TaxID=42253 RepID=UPI0009F970F6
MNRSCRGARFKPCNEWLRWTAASSATSNRERESQSSSESVIFIHGIPTWGYLWHGVLPALPQQYRLLTPDLIGFGYSDKGDRFDRSIQAQAVMLERWMDALKIEAATVIAHDIGGGVALRLATLRPGRVSKLCLLNTVCYDSWPIEAMLQLGHPEARRKLSASSMLTLLRQALKQGFASSPDAALLDGLLAPYATEVGKLSLIRNAAALNTNLTTEITPLLPSLAMPTLILWGEDDVFQSVRFGERLARDIPKAQLMRIQHAGIS